MRILLVEDDSMLADAIACALTQSAHSVDVVQSGDQADNALVANEYIVLTEDGGELTEAGARFLAGLGVDLAAKSRSKRIFCKPCLDWSERRHHIAGLVGAEICRCCLEHGWFTRERGTRALRLTAAGKAGLCNTFGVDLPEFRSQPSPTGGIHSLRANLASSSAK